MKKTLSKFENKTKIIVTLILMILVISGVTYGAFYTTKNQEVTNDIVAGCFSTTFTEGTNGSINLTNALPMSDAEALQTLTPYTFTLRNTCTANVKYNILLHVKDNSIDSDYIKVAYNESTPILLSDATVNTSYTKPNGYTDSYVITTGELKRGAEREFNIYLWLDENTTYESVSGKSWTGKIEIKNVPVIDQEDIKFLTYEYNGENTQSSFDDYISKVWSADGYSAVVTCSEGTNAVINKSGHLEVINLQYPASCKVIFEDIIPGEDSSGANAPVLADNMIPVVWNGSAWIKTTTDQEDWYDYSSQKWANAVTVVSDKRTLYKNLPVNEEVKMEDILGMWVWIPRYEYKYTGMSGYAGGNNTQPGEIKTAFVSGTSTQESTGYIIHPAFRNGAVAYSNNAGIFNAYQIGGWDKELTGFWYAKFETSGSTTEPKIIPDVSSLRNQNVSTQFTGASNVESYHGIDNKFDSHMSRNSEWGAVAYLSQSKYGKYGNSNYSGANKEIYINNSSGYYTGRSMGLPAGATGNNNSANGSYKYDDTATSDGTYTQYSGTGASTTGNIYGVYDMVGGSWEYQMGWLNTASENFGYRNDNGTDTNSAGFTSAPEDHKYYEEYTTTTASAACGGSVCYGQGLSETAGWYRDYNTMVNTTNPWFLRGALWYYDDNVGGGFFHFGITTGDANGYYGFRAVLAEK